MEKVRLGDVGVVMTGNTPKTSEIENYSSNDICFVKPSDVSDEYITNIYDTEFYISEHARNKARILPINSVLVTCIGIIGKVALNKVECAFNQQINAVIPDTSKCMPNYLAYAIESKKKIMQDMANAPVVPIINKTQFSDLRIDLHPMEEQKKIISILDKLTDLINKRKQQLEKLDELVKSRFVEMFGDPVHNSFKLPVLPMTEVCEIIDGDRGKNYPKQEDFFEEEYCLFLNAKNVTKNGFDFSNCMFITKEKDCMLRKGKLNRGDVVLTTRGTIGNLAFYTKDIPYENVRINSGMVILRMNHNLIDEGFFIAQFRMLVEDIKQSIASGSAQPQLPISTMNKIGVVMPEFNQQREFSDFVNKVDKSKSEIQKGLEKLELLKNALMQKYFG